MAQFTEWSAELEAALAEPFPAALIKQKLVKSTRIRFVEWHSYVARLNELVGPGWSMGAPIVAETGGKFVLGIPLSIFGVTRVNFGDEQEEHGNPDEVVDKETGEVKMVNRDYGSATTNAFAQAFKRSAAMFGLGLGLYRKDGTAPQQQERREDKPAADKRMPFGKSKGQTLGSLADDVLESTVSWCEDKDAEKFASLIVDCRAVLESRRPTYDNFQAPPLGDVEDDLPF